MIDVRVGHNILILPRLQYYIEKRDWDDMSSLIGNIYTINRIEKASNWEKDGEGGDIIYWFRDHNELSWFVYRDCFEITTRKRKRKLNLEEDPWGEENWGWE